MNHHGFLRVAAASPELRLADCPFNADRTLALMKQAEDRGVNLVVFPECGLTGYTCHDLFHQQALWRAAEDALVRVVERGEKVFKGVAVVGLPLMVDGQLFNAGAVVHAGKILGIVPKSYLPNYKEFYDARYFCPADNASFSAATVAGQGVPFGTNLLFACRNVPGFVLSVEVCEDLWMPVPPSSLAALMGATVTANLSASNELIGKAGYRRQLVAGQSGRCLSAYIYAACGVGESTTDLVFGGHCIVAENGAVLAESERFRRGGHLLVADLDLDRLQHDRVQMNSYHDANRAPDLNFGKFRNLSFELELTPREPALVREVEAAPFVPNDPATRDDRCREIFQTQVAALARRLGHIGTPPVSIGVSGGLDSTLALLVVCKTMDDLGVARDEVKALTMPGFGTTGRTKGNAHALMKALGVSVRECDIRSMCFEQMKALGHAPFGIKLDGETVESLAEKLMHLPPGNRSDLVFENVQARLRTSLLMNAGFVIGTGDLSELALGWCTYNADHMSMYNVNVSIPKTLVKFLVKWAAENEFDGNARRTLLDVVDTEISPELLPADASGRIAQSTEQSVGPYELVDFFLYHVLRFGASPEKILFLAGHAKFSKPYPADEVRHWLRVFLKRFFANQFKRSCLPDGPKVGSVSVSPRGDWRMPSDAAARVWLDAVEQGE
ncbi:nad synthetase : NAD synthase OS=Singulisphaera acidiphila (strain ATCC BAA-1392 / DSM 18658 / VKM B-2454 / MOB10) GN=Sinac_4658 PE=4 SV=1: CN_hydrolase: NAD_synthase [Gemmataceae bacterium]|nr:nad synthetase : NAD synthase OS=Singulisphaera acidiphila (strain ATCC BAA-1392 / DSM 18658 / VKM B-2454 / MOB10) GN=Sinac_4658 PE=4 SV=1: CN_hydrolase: NAD_synthase [Gemmataceae bacterium]VTT99120.1 nad synthetase : NAD synthase OS=Singulisphaera acidiphila (strain ATCC BAA-1392 / DSM 18658 / VKM B-2454 / MOB10) GN=Sinac_4658 PE=4 SV=1: CN_hydrolase: NAD_synthase [Gemmataceae bacterium]